MAQLFSVHQIIREQDHPSQVQRKSTQTALEEEEEPGSLREQQQSKAQTQDQQTQGAGLVP